MKSLCLVLHRTFFFFGWCWFFVLFCFIGLIFWYLVGGFHVSLYVSPLLRSMYLSIYPSSPFPLPSPSPSSVRRKSFNVPNLNELFHNHISNILFKFIWTDDIIVVVVVLLLFLHGCLLLINYHKLIPRKYKSGVHSLSLFIWFPSMCRLNASFIIWIQWKQRNCFNR